VAAATIAAVVLADKPKLFNQVDTMSSIFFFLTRTCRRRSGPGSCSTTCASRTGA